MLDKFYGIESGVSSGMLKIREDNLFVDNGMLSECGIIEHMAQSAAARAGFAFLSRGLKPPLGYIGAISGFRVSRLPMTGEEITTRIKITAEVFGVTLISAICSTGDENIAECNMKIFLDIRDAQEKTIF